MNHQDYRFLPIPKSVEEMPFLPEDEISRQIIEGTVAYINNLGYETPWIGYYLESEGVIKGTGAFKGGPKDGKVEIAYVTFEPFRQQGIAGTMCRELLDIAEDTDPNVRVTACTLREDNPSTRILKKHGFEMKEEQVDDEGMEVWYWVLP